MASKVKNNYAAIYSMHYTKTNSKAVCKAIKKVSTGMRVSGADDDASIYSISESMRALIRTLDQDAANVQNGTAMLKIALGGIDNIVDELRSVKELAINAANDTNTDSDRATIQKEVDSRLDNIDDIVNTTNYNGKLLLNGAYSQRPYTSILEPMGDKIHILGKNEYTIANDGYYDVTGFSGKIYITAQDVKLTGSTSNVSIVFGEGKSSLWLSDLNIDNSNYGDKSVISFTGMNNELYLDSTNILIAKSDVAVIDVGDDLHIYDSDNGNGKLTVMNQDGSKGAGIGTSTPYSAGSVTIISGTINVTSYDGAAIGSSCEGTFGDITISGGNITATAKNYGTAIGMGGTYSTLVHSNGGVYIQAGAVNVHSINSSYDIGPSYHEIARAGSYGSIYIEKYSGTLNSVVINDGVGGAVSLNADARLASMTVHDNPNRESILSNDDKTLRLQVGTKAGQRIDCYIGNMSIDAMGLEGLKVTTCESASSAINKVDKCIKYALYHATTVGAYVSRLEYTHDNITTEAENITAADSTMRDADMAKDMSDYAKSNVLLQAAQSMLAQANQQGNSVLNLVQ